MTPRGRAVVGAVGAFPVFAMAIASAEASDAFRFPGADHHRDHFYVTAYRDASGSAGGAQDWDCGGHAYPGHRGTDYGGGSFAGMDEGRDIVAAAAGVVTDVYDGAFDRCTTGDCPGGGGFGNYVRIAHEGGAATYYAHLKKYSIVVAEGDEVSCGQKLGEMGSSGASTGPHLHFEPRVDGVAQEPYAGPCAGSSALWREQGAYQGLPSGACPDLGPAHPILRTDGDVFGAGARDPGAEGVWPTEVGQELEARLYVSADAEGDVARDVVVGIDAPEAVATVLGWEVFDDHPGNACGGEMCPNDANAHPANPPREHPGERFDLELYALSPGETKMIAVDVVAEAPTPEGPAPLRFWVVEVPGVYEKPEFGSEPVDESGGQVVGGSSLEEGLAIEIGVGKSDADGGGGPGDEGGESAGAVTGSGCTAAPGAGALVWPLALLAGLLATSSSTRDSPRRRAARRRTPLRL